MVAWPAKLNVIAPPNAHWHVEELFSAGKLAICTVGAPGFHGVVTGRHGIGVRTPRAAAVAAATVGFDSELHIPNGGMFMIGLKSMMLAAGMLFTMTRLIGGTTSELGATPKAHVIIAPMTTCWPMRAV